MASSLFRIASRLHVQPAPNAFKFVSSKNSLQPGGCQNLMTIAIDTESELHDVLPVTKSYHPPQNEKFGPLNPDVLKRKEKGDWRCLTMEEKKALYQMSLNQSFAESAPVDEWKKILGGTFFAMGMMTIGIYVWFTQFVCREIENGSLPSNNSSSLSDDLEPNILMNFISDKTEPAFDSQARH